MAGTFPRGGDKRFKAGVRFAIQMGAAPDEDKQATFLFAPQLVYNLPADESAVPFDPDATVTQTTPAPLRVACAIEYFDAREQPITAFGNISPSRIEITVLDDEYELVKDAISVMIDGDIYDYVKTEPPSGLFSVGLFKLHFSARNET